MITSDALIVGEDWISEYYFTTDAKSESFQSRVLARRKAWDDYAAEAGESGRRGKADTVRSRFIAARTGLSADFVNLPSEPDAAVVLSGLHERIRAILGYNTGEFTIKQTGPLLRVSIPELAEAAPLVIVEAKAAESAEDLIQRNRPTLLSAYQPDDADEITSVSQLLSTLFVAPGGPKFALVLAGRWLLIAEKARWAEGRYLAVDLQLVCDRNDTKRGGEIDRALTCVSAESLAPDAEGAIWWSGVFEDSVKHTAAVTEGLREGIRLSIEIIANEVVRRRKSQGLDPLPADQAQPLARQSLRYLYRILFLLFAEASPELEVLPVGSEDYDQGYGLDRLRELILTELTGTRAINGTHIHHSLSLLFKLVDQGNQPREPQDGEQEGLTFNHLSADLFLPEATALIDETGLGNAALQKVLRHLLLSEEVRGKDRGFISYATLGINQLGAAYEGLMSYTGFFATEDLHEVAKDGNPAKGSWVVPVTRSQHLAKKDFVMEEDEGTGEPKAVVHERGSFVFRLAGRERQQSASYYTPEVLTKFTVSQALEELLDQDGHKTTAEEILNLTVCEPALGSGAFAIEAVRQLAEEYLTRKQDEPDEQGRPRERIDPEQYPAELQKVKAYIALHQVYGVDLNATAVEFAEITLWLDTMASGLQAPWFGLRLKRGNSLIGARRQVYTRAQVNDKSWLKATPADVPLTGMVEEMAAETVAQQTAGRIHHFLLPAEGWGSAVEAKEAAALAPENAAALRKWRSSVRKKLTATQINAMVELAHRVEALWQITLRRLQLAESEARRDIPLWGRAVQGHTSAVTRREIEKALAKRNGAYQRLRRVMDAWNALWFWPLTDATVILPNGDTLVADPPTLEQWIDACQLLLGRAPEARKNPTGMTPLTADTDWKGLNDAEVSDLGFASAGDIDVILKKHPWLKVCEDIAAQQGFFHWELDFATVFARGGFGLQVGNPPWVKPRTDVAALLAEGDPWWQLARKASQEERKIKRESALALPGIRDLVIDGTADVVVTAENLGSSREYPILAGLQPDLYRCFMERAWKNVSGVGIVALIHPETHFTDAKAGLLRENTYRRLRRHWQFINELTLYEIDHHVRYGVHVYGDLRDNVSFMMASSIYHPATVERSLGHDRSGSEPGLKDSEGNWDQRPHRNRILDVSDDMLGTWHAIAEEESVPVRQSRMVYTVNSSAADVLSVISRQPRADSLGLEFSRGWDEAIDRGKGYFESGWNKPRSWRDVILQGPHLYVATPMYKSPNPEMLGNYDWTTTDFENLADDAIPATAYVPTNDRSRYDSFYGLLGDRPARGHYRLAWRAMAANTGERTLIPAVIPPGAAHPNTIFCVGGISVPLDSLCVLSGFMSSIMVDFLVRAAPTSNIYKSKIDRSPILLGHPLQNQLLLRVLRLNCVTNAYADLWRHVYKESFTTDQWTGGRARSGRPFLGCVTRGWGRVTPFRIAEDRRQALVEIDALVALMLGVTADQLCTIYRTQFPVLYGYDHKSYMYDTNGRLVPNEVLSVWRKKGDSITEAERTAINQAGNAYTYELPFTLLDREKDIREAYAEFERRLAVLNGEA
jgi:hypothetical protein